MEKYTFLSGLMHFSRAQGTPGFTWKFIGAYILTSFILLVVFGTISAFVVPSFTNEFLTTGSARSSNPVMLLITFGYMLLAALVMSIFEAAALRRYIYGNGFSLRFGAQELRLVGVYVAWFITLILSYFAVSIVSGLISMLFVRIGAEAGGTASNVTTLLASLLMFAIPLVLLGIVAKISSASAMTVRDGKFTFFPAARVTIGRFWKVYFAYILVYMGLLLAMIITQVVLMQVFLGALGATSPTDASGIAAGGLALFMLLTFTVLTAVGQLVTLGITSRLVLTDPEWDGRAESLAGAFT
ncbi:hypothetical protein [Ponticaulis sp.]|uniref:hypothetical protein n=1 Tax=Ponticaulis sp. TaxID=2020902 RepID=UPI00262D049F|nr:hypothetical protein [Ponticaulis sp.]MDF1680582.1 hypothetical protein [Ponticaulis sp.]